VETFKKADDVLLQAVRGISDLITVRGYINLDFADVRTVMAEMGMAMMGAAVAEGENRAVEAAQRAISSPLLDDISIQGARGVLLNITAGNDLSLHEVNEAATLIQEEAHEQANIIFGAVIDESMGDKLRVTVIATGFGEPEEAGVLKPATESFLPRTELGRRSATDFRAGPTPLAAAPGRRSASVPREGPRRIVRRGLIEDGENPVWHRPANEEMVEEPTASGVEEAADYDIPTFLRKQAD